MLVFKSPQTSHRSATGAAPVLEQGAKSVLSHCGTALIRSLLIPLVDWRREKPSRLPLYQTRLRRLSRNRVHCPAATISVTRECGTRGLGKRKTGRETARVCKLHFAKRGIYVLMDNASRSTLLTALSNEDIDFSLHNSGSTDGRRASQLTFCGQFPPSGSSTD